MSYVISLAGLIIAFIIYAEANCPPAHSILPCTCRERCYEEYRRGSCIECLEISNLDNLEEVFERSWDMPFYNFGLYTSILNYFPSKAVFLKHMLNVRIVNCTMVALFEDDPAIDNIVQAIVIDNVKFQRGIEWKLFKNLKQLKSFYAIYTEMRSLGRSFVENISPVLEKFFLRNTKLRKVHPNAFTKLDNLLEISIINGFVREIKRSMFPTNCGLATMDFSGNLITSLPEDIFNNMPILGYVNLENNKISTLSSVESPQHHFIKVELKNNPIRCDCNLQWLVEANRVVLGGQCESPEELKGRYIGDLRANDFNYCS